MKRQETNYGLQRKIVPGDGRWILTHTHTLQVFLSLQKCKERKKRLESFVRYKWINLSLCWQRHCCSTQKGYHDLTHCLKRWIRDPIPLLASKIWKSVKNVSLPCESQGQGLLSPARLEKVFERASCSDVHSFNDPVRRRSWGGHREACPLHNQLLTVKNSLWGFNDMSFLQPLPTLALKNNSGKSITWSYTWFCWKERFNTWPERTLCTELDLFGCLSSFKLIRSYLANLGILQCTVDVAFMLHLKKKKDMPHQKHSRVLQNC